MYSAILNRRMLTCVFTGLASGMPLYLLIQLVPAWLRDSGVSLAEIGLFALVGLPYTWKFLWAPLMDRWQLPWAAPGLDAICAVRPNCVYWLAGQHRPRKQHGASRNLPSSLPFLAQPKMSLSTPIGVSCYRMQS